jgi:thiol:disulfide interchange protein
MAGAFAAALAAGACAQPQQKAPTAISWNIAYDAALADAGKTGRPILLDFYTDW